MVHGRRVQGPSIKVAEAAKVIENTQRDLNIALMNELSLIFDRMGIRTRDVLAAAGTKWNFLKFYPGLVGGHCIGVDPYYLTTKAESSATSPRSSSRAGASTTAWAPTSRRSSSRCSSTRDRPVKGAKVGVLGLTFKENVQRSPQQQGPRHPRRSSRQFGIEPIIHDPIASAPEAVHEYGLTLSPIEAFKDLDAVILAVSHKEFLALGQAHIEGLVHEGGVLVDVKSVLEPTKVSRKLHYWSV
jgi:UDP-N-acetyl-D-galactosamine dehydrogenase